MKKLIMLIFSSLMIMILVADENLPSKKEIIKNYINALGGREKIEKLETRICTGFLVKDVSWKKPPYNVVPFEATAKAPNKFMIKYTEDGAEIRSGFDGKNGWKQTADDIVSDEYIGRPKLSWICNPQNVLQIDEFFTDLKVTGIQSIHKKQAYVLQPQNLPIEYYSLYFDVETGLLLGIGYHWEVLDYREVDGVLIPFRIIAGRKGGSYTYLFKDIQHNEPIDNALFSKPEK